MSLLAKKLALALAATVMALALAEGVIRALRLAPEMARLELDLPFGQFVESENPILKYVPRPGSKDVNALGFRDRECPVAKPPRTFRIVVVGDSIGYGFCTTTEALDREKTFSKVLEKYLNESRTGPFERVEVLNLSVSGYDTEQEVEFLRVKGVGLSPDLVIVAYCLNDNEDRSAELPAFERPSMLKRAGRGAYRVLFLNSHLFRLGACRWSAEATKPSTAPASQPADDRLHRGFRKLKELAEKHRFRTLVVVFPNLEDFQTYSQLARHKEVEQACSGMGFLYLDLMYPFFAASEGDYRRIQGRCVNEHPDEGGHMIAAWTMKEFIADHKLIPAE